ncbi:MAG: TIGR01458 family HAD-type hydrolase, partial [Cyanobacteria bacterium J06641_5]
MPLSLAALFLDLSGVLYEGERAIAGAGELVNRARQRGLVLRFVTNTASRGRQAILARLESMGISVMETELFTAPIAAKRYIQQQKLRPFCLVHEAIRDEFADLAQQDPNCVLLGDARDGLHYQ